MAHLPVSAVVSAEQDYGDDDENEYDNNHTADYCESIIIIPDSIPWGGGSRRDAQQCLVQGAAVPLTATVHHSTTCRMHVAITSSSSSSSSHTRMQTYMYTPLHGPWQDATLVQHHGRIGKLLLNHSEPRVEIRTCGWVCDPPRAMQPGCEVVHKLGHGDE